MSHIGKLQRGLKWYEQRTVNGLPSDIAGDVDKMEDVDYYTKHVKDKDAGSVNAALIKIRNLEREPRIKNKTQILEAARAQVEGE